MSPRDVFFLRFLINLSFDRKTFETFEGFFRQICIVRVQNHLMRKKYFETKYLTSLGHSAKTSAPIVMFKFYVPGATFWDKLFLGKNETFIIALAFWTKNLWKHGKKYPQVCQISILTVQRNILEKVSFCTKSKLKKLFENSDKIFGSFGEKKPAQLTDCISNVQRASLEKKCFSEKKIFTLFFYKPRPNYLEVCRRKSFAEVVTSDFQVSQRSFEEKVFTLEIHVFYLHF